MDDSVLDSSNNYIDIKERKLITAKIKEDLVTILEEYNIKWDRFNTHPIEL